MAAIHAVDAAGRVYVGVPTLRAAYAAVGLTGRSSLLALPGVRGLAARAYQLLARNRHHLPDHLIELLFERASQRAAGAPGCAAHRRLPRRRMRAAPRSGPSRLVRL